jgi:hypothetical protein
MGLSISVGILAELAENEPEALEHMESEFRAINDLLREHGLPEHQEPKSLPMRQDRSGTTGFPYSFLHYLRRFYARFIAQPNQIPPPVSQGDDPTNDVVLDSIASPEHHLLWHSDCEGYYLPIDFAEVLEGEGIAGTGVGSSVRLREELLTVAAPLGIVLHDGQLTDADAAAIAEEGEEEGPYWIERLVWLTLFEACRLSIEHSAAIHFG